MMRGKRSRELERALLDELDFKWMISIWTISFWMIRSERERKKEKKRTKLSKFGIYISIYQHLVGSIHHRIDRTEVWDKRKRILIVVSTKVICYQIMKVTSFWTISKREKKYPRTVITQLSQCVCVCWTEVYSGVIIQWPLFKLDSVVMPIKRIQLLLLLLLLVVLQRNLSLVHSIPWQSFVIRWTSYCHWSMLMRPEDCFKEEGKKRNF